ncbi:hypothetical protein LSCM4_06149 [Leishmania orientalis]|uniref:Uncharacterized protein n=1 Tax=Leishmania orientalis TaxID=2249476 RepID=A0A836KW89_9TRYP|nr:hypothetical protein LSCM4_06149 [Leishmania orientalis]
MGAVPSRECTSLFSYFRGSYEVGMVPLTKYYFGRDTDTAAAAVNVDGSIHVTSLEQAATTGRKPQQQSFPLHGYSRSHMRQQLRQQLLLMRRDPAVLYANARDAENILKSLSHHEKCEKHSENENASEVRATPADAASLSSLASVTKAALASAATGVAADADHNVHGKSSAGNLAGALENECSDSTLPAPNHDSGDGDESSDAERLLKNYWRIMPESNFTEEDLDRFLELVDATLFDTNEELLSADPVIPGTGAALGTSSAKPFMPVPCALCLAYPDGKEREGALALDGRVINIIGYFGLMTQEMQDAFKIVKRLPSDAEKPKQQHAHEAGSSSVPLMFLNTAILTSAGDRTLERVLVLAAVMLRQQFHTIGRRHVLQAKLNHLLRLQSEHLSVDVQMVRYLKTLLALPRRADQQQPFFDPLLEIPLPSIPSGIYTPTQYVNAASNEVSLRPHTSSLGSCGRLPINSFSDEGKLHSANGGSSPSAMGGALSACGASSRHVLLHPQQNAGGVLGIALKGPGAGFGSEGACSLLAGDCCGALGAHVSMPHPSVVGPLPLNQSDEDAITLALCRRMERARVVIETASNNYSALKSLTENFAFLCCQILLDQSPITMELIELPALVETPSFKPAEFARTVATTLGTTTAEEARAATDIPQTAADDEKKPLSGERLTQPRLPPSSAVLIKLDPLHVSQATMWASSFFHCPMLLPSGGWVKYKLKDECEQLRHVLQNKDMLIAHWRKADADQAGQYLGKHTARLLEHVRALQAETEEARALSAEYWMQRPLYVNQDGRKYALYQSRYGTMLIGVRAFTTSNAPSTAAAGVKEERSGSAKAAAGSNVSSFSGGNASLAPPAGRGGTFSASLHSANSGSGSGPAIAPRAAAPRLGCVSGSRTGHTGALSSNDDGGGSPKSLSNNATISDQYGRGVGGGMGGSSAGYFSSGLYATYPPHAANSNNGTAAYVPALFMQSHLYLGNSSGGYDSPPYIMGSSNGRPGEAVQYFASSSASHYHMEMAAGYGMPLQQQSKLANMNKIPSTHMSMSVHSSGHTHVGGSPALGAAGWVTLQPNSAQISPPSAPSHLKGVAQGQQQSEAMGRPSGCTYAAAPMSMSYKPALPTHYIISRHANPAAAGLRASASSPQLPRMSGEQVSNSSLGTDVAATPQLPLESAGGSGAQHALVTGTATNAAVSRPPTDAKASWANDKGVEVPRLWEPAEAVKSTASSTQHGRSTSAAPAAAAACPHGCVGMNRDEVGSAGFHLSGAQRNGSATQQATRGSGDPHVTKASEESGIADRAAAPKATVLQSVMPWSLQGAAGWAGNDDTTDGTTQLLLRSAELLDTDDDEMKRVPPAANSHKTDSRETAGEEGALEFGRVARQMSGRDMCLAKAPHPHSHTPRTKSTPIMSMLMAGEQPSKKGDATTSSAVSMWQLSFPSLAEPHKPAQAPPFPPAGSFPVYVLQLPAHAPSQQQRPQSQPPLPTASPSPAAAAPADKPFYYAMTNSVPLLMQPSTTTSGMGIAYSNSPAFHQGVDASMPYPHVPPQPQQQPMAMIRHGQGMMSTPGLDKRQVVQGSLQVGADWDGQYHVFPNGPDSLAGSFVSSRTRACNSSGNILFHPSSSSS